jgi:hypothetical protein
MRFWLPILAVVFLALPASAQNPDDVRFVLAIKGGRTTFRIGEEIDLEFQFSSSAKEEYALRHPCSRYPTRRTTAISSDDFTVEPNTGTVDPLANTTVLIWINAASCISSNRPEIEFLTTTPYVQDRILNEWVEFRQTGRYRISATTTHQIVNVVTSTAPRFTSNSIEIEIVAPEAGWASRQTQESIAILKTSSNVDEIVKAGRTLRFLETLDAVPALVEYFDKSRAGDELKQGLISSPYRKEILAAMEAQIADPDFPITRSWFQTYDELARVSENGPPPRPTEGALSSEFSDANSEARLLWGKAFNDYSAKATLDRKRDITAISDALAQKQGQARITTLNTLQALGNRP